jgi:hypothetical protein
MKLIGRREIGKSFFVGSCLMGGKLLALLVVTF